MMFWRAFHFVNETLAFVFGFGLNTLLLILILTTKIKSMRKFNILLIQCCCIDMLQVLISFIVKPIIVFHNKNEYFLSNGFLRPIGGPIEMLGIVSWTSSVCFCVCATPISYIFRYRTVCLNETISTKFYVTSVIIAFLSASSYGIYAWKFHYLDNHHLAYLAEESLGWLIADNEGEVKAISFCPAVSFGFEHSSSNSKE